MHVDVIYFSRGLELDLSLFWLPSIEKQTKTTYLESNKSKSEENTYTHDFTKFQVYWSNSAKVNCVKNIYT